MVVVVARYLFWFAGGALLGRLLVKSLSRVGASADVSDSAKSASATVDKEGQLFSTVLNDIGSVDLRRAVSFATAMNWARSSFAQSRPLRYATAPSRKRSAVSPKVIAGRSGWIRVGGNIQCCSTRVVDDLY